MRAPSDMSPKAVRSPGRGRILLIVAAIALFLIFTSLRQIAEFWTDFLWFESLGFSPVWTRTLLIKLQLGALFTAGFFLLLWVNLFIADRISPKFRPLGPDEDLLNRYHQVIDRRAGVVRVIVAGVFAFITGAGMSSQWNEWVLFTNGGDFATTDPIYGENVGFYVFKLPFLLTVTDWLFAALIIVLLVTAVAHYLNGGIRMQSPFERVTPQVKAHLSVLLALLALVKAADYWLQRYELTFSQRGFVNGMTYTEVNAQLPAIYLLLFIALAAFVLFILNIRRRGWVLPVVAVGMWALVQLVMGAAYPAFYQRFIVEPEQSTKEASAIDNNIDATRKAYGIDDVKTVPFDYSANAGDAATGITDNPDTTRNIQLLDPRRVTDTFQKLQSETAPYQFSTLDTDRYSNMKVAGGGESPTQVVIANREVNSETIPTRTWEGLHLSYTRGYGLALAAGGAVTEAGGPEFAVRDVDPMTFPGVDFRVDRPEVYYGEQIPDYSVVGTTAQELAPGVEGAVEPGYLGSGGVLLDSFPRRLAFGLRFSDTNLVISNFITDQSRILFLRDVRERAQKLAPFLTFDSNPYPAVVDDHMVYILDAYTTSDSYPNSQYYPGSSTGSGELRATRAFNYVRNSVKGVVDTYDGTVKLYVIDPTDPVINAYRGAFPELFYDSSEMSIDLVSHLRYPEDLFRVQTDMWGRYHISDSKGFYDRTDAWEPPPTPPESPPREGAASTQSVITVPAGPGGTTTGVTTKSARMSPNYVINQLPNEGDTSFKIMRMYQPYSDDDSKQQLTAFMTGGSDGNQLGRLTIYEPTPVEGSTKAPIDGPGIASATILNDAEVSRQITLLNTEGSNVSFGDLLMVPVDKSILYVRSFYVSVSGTQRVPQVKGVIVYFQGETVFRKTLREALQAMFPSSRPVTLEGAVDESLPIIDDSTLPSDPTSTTTTTTTPSTTGTTRPTSAVPLDLQSMVTEANRLLAEAEVARKSDDANAMGNYQRLVNEAHDLLRQAESLLGQGATDGASTSTTSTTQAPAGDAAPGAGP